MTRSLGNGKARAIWSASVLARGAATISRCGRGRSRSGHSLGAGNNSQYQAKEQVEYQAKNTILWRKRPKRAGASISTLLTANERPYRATLLPDSRHPTTPHTFAMGTCRGTGFTKMDKTNSGYWRGVRRHARKQTRETLFGSVEQALIEGFGYIVWLVAVYAILTATDRQHELAVGLIAAAAPILVYPIVYWFKLSRIPPRLRARAEKRYRRALAVTVDRYDLQLILGGMFIDDTYLYPVGFVLVKQFSVKFELESLMNGFQMIQVRAPRRSWVTLNCQFLNRRQESNKYAFYFRDGDGDEHKIEDIYEHQTVLLDDFAMFGLKLTIDPSYELDETASLLITVQAWTKAR